MCFACFVVKNPRFDVLTYWLVNARLGVRAELIPAPVVVSVIGGSAMSIHRVALIFDDRARPETTGVYCRRALERLVDVAHFRPDEIAQIPREGFDLYINIDDGFDYRLPSELRPSVFWAIDTHVNFDSCLHRARGFDFVFAAQRDGAEALRQAGIASATWLPLACDPEIHRKHDVPKEYDVAFVGNILPGPREELLHLLRRKYRGAFIGQCYFDDIARTYSAARTSFNRSIKNDVNMRVFEVIACGSLLLTNELTDNWDRSPNRVLPHFR